MNLPPEIASSLRSVIARVRRIQSLKGGLATGAALIFSIIGVMIIDWAFNIESNAIRWALTISAMIITVITFWRYLLRPLSRKISLTTVARWVETHHPEMQERISTAVELAGRGNAGSQGLIDEVIKEAALDASKLDPKSELSTRAARTPIWSVATAVGLLALLFVCFPKITPILFARAVAPYADLGNAYSNKIRYLTEDQQVVTAGDSFTIEAAYKASQEKRAVIILTYPDGTEVREQMTEDLTVEGIEGDERPLSFRLPTLPETSSTP
jgi:hypothetical protein